MSNSPHPRQVTTRVAQSASGDPTSSDFHPLAQANQAPATAPRADTTRHIFVFVERGDSPLAHILAWFARDRALRRWVRSVTISEWDVGYAVQDEDVGSRSVTAVELIQLCHRVDRLSELRLRGLNIVAHGPSVAFIPMGPHSVHTLTITHSSTDTTLLAVASVATSLPSLTTLQLFAWGGSFDGNDYNLMRTMMLQRSLSLRVLRIRNCSVEHVKGVNLILAATAATLRHLSIELTATPEPEFDHVHPSIVSVSNLTRLEELDIYISIHPHGVWHDVLAHSDPVLYMLQRPPPNIRVAHVVFRNTSPTAATFLAGVADFPIRALCARLWLCPDLECVVIAVGGLETSARQRRTYWRSLLRNRRAWREVVQAYGRGLIRY